MTDDTHADLLAAIDTADRETRALLESLRDEDMAKKTDESNWNVGQLAGHVAQVPWATYVLGRLAQNKNASAPGPLSFVLHLGNWWNTRRYRRTSRQRLLDDWAVGVERYREYVERLPAEVLDNGGDVTGRGRMTVREFVLSAPDHTRQHADTIQKALRG
jgi:hypothetical protein